ncbi:MAG: type II secretion system protein [Phycisphaerales bacterium]
MRRTGFTLVELLVSIAVISILISILLPALGEARRAAQTVQCLSQMRQLVIAQRSYANDFKGALIGFGLAESGSALDTPTWLDQLQDYYETPLVNRSPADTSPHWPRALGGDGVTIGTDERLRTSSYGLNELVTPNTSAIDPLTQVAFRRYGNINAIRNPHAVAQFVIMAFEGEFAVADHVHPLDWWLVFDPNGWPRRIASQIQTDAHGGPPQDARSRSNYAFLDGHASTLELNEVYEGPERNSFDPRVAR